MTTEELKDKIKLIMNKSWFDLDREDGNMMIYSTRRHGNVGDEITGVEDLREALRLKTELILLRGWTDVDIEEVDEWVFINIELIPD